VGLIPDVLDKKRGILVFFDGKRRLNSGHIDFFFPFGYGDN